jgi:hypothetical protein
MSPALLLWLAPLALAAAPMFGTLIRDDDKQPLPWHCSDVSVVQGTVPYAVAVEARESHARTYSAVAELEQEVLPRLAAKSEGGLFRMSSSSLFRVTRLPSIACGELASLVYDVGSYNMSVAAGNERLQLFYSAAANYALVSQDGYRRVLKHGGGFLLGHFYSFSAPLWGSRVINADQIGGDAFTDSWGFMSSGDGAIGGVSLDYIAGMSADVKYAALGAGYVGSRGLYVHAAQPQSGAFFDTVSELRDLGDGGEGPDWLRYLKTGLAGFRWFQKPRSDLGEKLGATDATYARFRVVPPTGRVLTSADADRVTTDDLTQDVQSLTTLRQRDLWRYADVSARYQLRPTPQLYEFSVTGHTLGYHRDLLAPRDRRAWDRQITASATVGLVNLAERTYFGVPGGVRPHIDIDAVILADERDPDGSAFTLSFKVNDPDTLILFPYAQGAREFHAAAEIGW